MPLRGVFIGLCLLVVACSPSTATSAPPEPSVSPSTAPLPGPCHPANTRQDCTVAVVLLNEPVTLAVAEAVATDAGPYLNALYRVDPVCVPKDYPISPGSDQGETPSRRIYWQADERMARIAADRRDGLVPPPTIGGFDSVIDARMEAEWRFAQMPGVEFYALVLWVDDAGLAQLEDEYTVETYELGGDFGRYTHSEGRGEIRVDRDFEPRPPPLGEIDDCEASAGGP